MASSSFKICAGTARSIFPVNLNRSQLTNHQLNPRVSFSKKSQKRCYRVSLSLKISESPPFDHLQYAVLIPPLIDHKEKDDRRSDANIEEKLVKWMKGSVKEIVKNLKKAPLLVHVYEDEKEEGIRAEPAVVEEWDVIKREWENGERSSPDGLIFVEELRGQEAEEEEEEDGVTKVWGIVVQGRGRGACGPVCYLLKTTRVGAGTGLGWFCTHFCLIRVSSFWKPAFAQFIDSWLLH